MSLPPLRNPSWSVFEDTKNKVLFQMANEPSFNTRSKLETEIKLLKEELRSLNRNYEALLLKQKEDNLLINKLKQELLKKEEEEKTGEIKKNKTQKIVDELNKEIDELKIKIKNEREKYLDSITKMEKKK